MKFLTYIVLIFSVLTSCNSEKKTTNSKENQVILDSVNLHIDSIYARKSKKIDNFFAEKFKRKLFNGTVLFAENGKVVHKGAYGYKKWNRRRRWKKEDELQVNSVFQLASVSKPFTAYAILHLYQEGKLELTDTVQKFIPYFPYEGITIEHLLIHRSGLTNYMYFTDEKWPDWKIPISNRQVINLMIQYEPDTYYRPNRRYNYSNTGYIILADIVERVSGMSFEHYMKKNVFEPLGMNNTSVKRYKLNEPYHEGVYGHEKNFRPTGVSYLNGTVGDKGVFSTVEDMFKWDRALQKGSLVKLDILNKAYIGRHRELHKDDNYGYGWRINDVSKDKKIVYHRGWWKGFRTYFVRVLDEDKTIIVLNNSTYGRFLKNDELIELLKD